MIQGDNILGNSNDSTSGPMDFIVGGIDQPFELDEISFRNSPFNFDTIDDVDLQAINSTELLRSESLDEYMNREVYKISEAEDVKPDLLANQVDIFPDLDEFDNNLNFDITYDLPENSTKNTWDFCEKLKKIYIKSNEIFHCEVFHRPVSRNLFLRAMMVFTDEICSPVKRCPNHIHNDKDDENESRKYSIIRTENSNAEYQGKFDGKTIKDRLSVVIPLSSVRPNENNLVKQSIAIKFVCQNSCIGRKPTAVLFYLEDDSGQMLSKKVMKIKICSCPKRDKSKEQIKHEKLNGKRNSEQAEFPINYPERRPTKIPKIKQQAIPLSTNLSILSPPLSEENVVINHIKTESINYPQSGINGDSSPSIQSSSNGAFILSMPLPNIEIVTKVIEMTQNLLAGESYRDTQNCTDWKVYLEGYNRIQQRDTN